MRAYEFILEADDLSVPQPGPSSGKAAQLNPDANLNQQNLTLKQIHKSIQGIPYHKDVIRDYDKKDFSWNVTPKAVEYAKFLKDNPESLKTLPPIVAVDGKLDDGAHRISALGLLQKRMDRDNPLWKTAKLPVVFASSSDVAKISPPAARGSSSVPVRGGFVGSGGPVPTGAGNLMHQLNPQKIMEEIGNYLSDKIFFARSNKTPKGWSYDHVGFITQDGKQIQMSGHKGNDVYVTNAVTDDPEFPKQNIKIVSLSKPVSVPTTNSVGAENCGTFVANVLHANGIKGIGIQKIYSVFKKPQEQEVT